MRRRLRRWWGLLSLAGARFAGRVRIGESRRAALHVSGVALPVALLLVVSAVALGLAGGTAVESPDVDYWIVPESGSARSTVVSVGGPRLGEVHRTSERLAARGDVDHATPVLASLLEFRAAGGEALVLVVGVVPRAAGDEFAGVSTAGLTPGDPYYADGSYDGRWTGEVVLSPAAAALLNASTGSRLRAGPDRRFVVANVSGGGSTPAGGVPVAVVHLAELQSITGAAEGDQADQLLVATTDPGVRETLEGVYPRSLVVARGELAARGVVDSELALAMGVGALVVAFVVGGLFAASTLGMAIAADARNRAVLSALGFSGRSRAGVVAAEALIVAALGGALGVGLGMAGIALTNALASRSFAVGAIAEYHPALVGYGLAVGLAIGLATVPYLLVLSRRTTTAAALSE